MSSRLLVVLVATFLSLALGLAPTAQARKFSVTGGGGQAHIGNGLALPIQAAATVVGTAFPPLLVPLKAGPAPIVSGTVAKPLLTFAGSVMHPATKRGYQRKLVLPAPGIMSHPAARKRVGVLFSNPAVFAVETNLKYTWPAAPAVFSSGMVGPMTIANFGGTMVYSNVLGSRFGGPAQFAIAGAVGGGLFGAISPITVFLKINATTPPCTFPAKTGCVAGLLLGKPTGLAAVGGAALKGTTMMLPNSLFTPGYSWTAAQKNLYGVKIGATSPTPMIKGTILPTGMLPAPAVPIKFIGALNNMASSQPGPWTTGQIIMKNKSAKGVPETFTIEGKDARTANGGGTIQMVSGAVSARALSGGNANRGWLRLTLAPANAVPSMSWVGLSATAGLLILSFGYAMRRRIFAQN